MIQVYTGCGKGKTTAAFGLAVRAAGAGMKVYIAQFMKADRCSAIKPLKKIKGITVEHFGTCRFIKKPSPIDARMAGKGLKAASKAISCGRFDMIIMDEINNAMKIGVIKTGSVLKLIKKAPRKTEVVLTGRDAPKEIIEAADLVSEVKEVKHYFKKGVCARTGIEY